MLSLSCLCTFLLALYCCDSLLLPGRHIKRTTPAVLSRLHGTTTDNDATVPEHMKEEQLALSAKPLMRVYDSAQTLSDALCTEIVDLAKLEIEAKGRFFLAIPGGSVLKQLKGLQKFKDDLDWSKVTVFYVCHKCAPGDTDRTTTHFKAKSVFLDTCGVVSSYFPGMNADVMVQGHNTAAHEYTKQLKDHVPHHEHVPIFDYMLLGVGKDGSIASLHPKRKEVSIKDHWVVTVDVRQPAHISLTLPVINSAKNIRIVATGSDKADIVRTGALAEATMSAVPVCGVRAQLGGGQAVWMVDKDGAGKLMADSSVEYEKL